MTTDLVSRLNIVPIWLHDYRRKKFCQFPPSSENASHLISGKGGFPKNVVLILVSDSRLSYLAFVSVVIDCHLAKSSGPF